MSKFITLNILEILELEEGMSYLKKMLSSLIQNQEKNNKLFFAGLGIVTVGIICFKK